MTPPQYDVIVVGFGLSGSAVIHRLSEQPGVRLLAVDRGECRDPDSLASVDEYGALPRIHDGILFSGDTGPPVRVRRWWGRDVAGGGSLTWYGQLSRFEESDVALSTRARACGRLDLADAVVDWPIRVADLAPYYRQVEQLLAPVGPPAWGGAVRGDCEYVVRRPALSNLETRLLEELSSHGMRPYVGATCLGGRAWERNPVDPMTGIPLPGCGLRHRRNWLSMVYRTARARASIDLLGRHDVRRVLHERGRVIGVELASTDGESPVPFVVEARCVVVAASPVDTVGVLHRSSVPDPEGLLGTGFTYSTEVVGYVRTALPRSQSPVDRAIGTFSSVVVRDFYLGTGGSCIKGGKIAIYDALAVESPERHLRGAPFDEAGRLAVATHERDHYVLKLSFKGESFPWPGKYVTTTAAAEPVADDIPVIHYMLHPHDLEVRRFALLAFERVARALPGGELLSVDLPSGPGLISGHQHGGVRFGTSPSDSLLDPMCRSWTIAGLYVADSSCMPTSGATNTSLTISANALRVADCIAREILLPCA